MTDLEKNIRSEAYEAMMDALNRTFRAATAKASGKARHALMDLHRKERIRLQEAWGDTKVETASDEYDGPHGYTPR